MSKFLMIENHGVAPLEGFTVMGISSARGKSNAIGQFGSGNKHAILLLLRHGLVPEIALGTRWLKFSTEPAKMGDTHYNKVIYSFGAKRQELGACLEYGELDWDSVDMALREFVSNALDACDGDFSKIKVNVVDSPTKKDGFTRVFVPLTPDVMKFFMNMGQKFLHVSGQQTKGLLLKKTEGPARIYRKGVFVRELANTGKPAMFDYNFGDDLKIDEARNLDEYSVQIDIADVIGRRKEALQAVFKSLNKSDAYLEHKLPSWRLEGRAQDNRTLWQAAWKEEYGDAIAAHANHLPLIEQAIRKGYKVVVIHNDGWYGAIKSAKIPTALDVCDNVNKHGHEILEPTAELVKLSNDVWAMLELVGMTNGKTQPPVKSFQNIMEGGEVVCGYYDPDNRTIMINRDNEGNHSTVLEEYAHYITGAKDCTRDFQQYAFSGWVNLMKETM